MNDTLKITRFQISEFKKSAAIFYLVILLLCVPGIIVALSVADTTKITFGGFGMSTTIFLFISGLNCFKSSFRFTMANNISRKRFYAGNAIAIASLAAFMAAGEVIISNGLRFVVPYQSMFEQLYRTQFFLGEFAWSFGLYFLFVNLGWMINMIYYRANKRTKVIVSLIPAILVILIPTLNNYTDGAVVRAIVKFFGAFFGFSYNYSHFISTINFFIGAGIMLAFSYLLIRRAPVKD